MLDIHIQKNEAGLVPHTINKNERNITDLDIKAETIKLLEEAWI